VWHVNQDLDDIRTRERGHSFPVPTNPLDMVMTVYSFRSECDEIREIGIILPPLHLDRSTRLERVRAAIEILSGKMSLLVMLLVWTFPSCAMGKFPRTSTPKTASLRSASDLHTE